MNQIKPKTEYQGPAVDQGLSEAEAKLLHRVLISGDAALAQRKDLVELHKRLVQMITTINQGLGEAQLRKAAQDRAALVEKLDVVERAVNSMDGALRIELEPMLARMVDAAVNQRIERKPHPLRRMIFGLVLVAAGLAVGATYSSNIRYISVISWEKAREMGQQGIIILSPNGGSGTGPNRVE